MSDRMVHAELGDEKIVRYDRAGKWYVEFDPPNYRPARHIGVQVAARRAVELRQEGGSVSFGLPGGRTFDRLVNQCSVSA